MPTTPATWEVEAGESLSLRPTWAISKTTLSQNKVKKVQDVSSEVEHVEDPKCNP
jgi:hypothetical protein